VAFKHRRVPQSLPYTAYCSHSTRTHLNLYGPVVTICTIPGSTLKHSTLCPHGVIMPVPYGSQNKPPSLPYTPLNDVFTNQCSLCGTNWNIIHANFRCINAVPMAQAVSRRPLNVMAWVRSPATSCVICGGKSGTGTGLPTVSLWEHEVHGMK
jgi:hypothetical protein